METDEEAVFEGWGDESSGGDGNEGAAASVAQVEGDVCWVGFRGL